ncbi:uncharacterized protein LOC131434908 [Malaya genurostris]|uniref:uncharacterized protein LOC131434908 n=1 Tax=Malaya genurostris TaxID=325434 RepID=UPI0026F3A706|nr:uncharacterized protein LOC131434908 [Malaya genurostris]
MNFVRNAVVSTGGASLLIFVTVAAIVILLDRCGVSGRVYKKCELARELALKQVPEDQITDWLCIAEHGSKLNSSAVNLKYKKFGGSAYYGIFQISDLYGCLKSSSICGLTCADLRDDEVEDDIDCMRKIYDEYSREIGDGFAAWPTHKTYCQDPVNRVSFGDCLNEEVLRFQAYYKKKKAKSKKEDLVIGTPVGKVYDRCELAVELRDKYQLPEGQIATWVCIAYHESRFNTSAEGRLNADGSGDHGLFQISDIYWCSATNFPGKACGVTCEDLRNNDISDDIRCLRKIFDEHQRISGNGFTAWTVYRPYCQGREDSFVHNCFDDQTPTTTGLRPRPGITAPTSRPGTKTSGTVSTGKIYDRCELANDLLHKYNIPKEQIPTWVCIAYHESGFNTSAEGRLNADGSGDHGLFQISDIYWCSPPGNGWACSVSCDQLKDNDIADDVQCIRTIYEEHQRLSGDGFNAWSVYQPHCKDKSANYAQGCFGSDEVQAVTSALPKPGITAPTRAPSRTSLITKGKVYKRCELVRELHFKHHYSIEDAATWTCIAQYQSNFNTAAVGSGPGDVKYHGMFQLSDEYWCSPPGRGWVCGMPCSDLEDDDITDDLACMRHIYEEHQRISGDGFNAWAVYQPYCKGKSTGMAEGCFEEGENALVPVTTTTRKPTKKKNVGVGKIYQRCELAQELYYKHRLPFEQIATWVCIAHRESNYNVSAIGRLNADGSEDHGLFQISDIYWCSPPGKGWVCNIPCSDLEDNDITDDLECMKLIFEEHTRLSGDGFNAWAVYRPYCKGNADHYINGCFDDPTTTPRTTTRAAITRTTRQTTKRTTYSSSPAITSRLTIEPSTSLTTTTKPTLPSETSRITQQTNPKSTTSRPTNGFSKATTSLYEFYLHHFGRPNSTPVTYAPFAFRTTNDRKTSTTTATTTTTPRFTLRTQSNVPKIVTSTAATRATQFVRSPKLGSTSVTSASTAKYSNFDQLFDRFKHG